MQCISTMDAQLNTAVMLHWRFHPRQRLYFTFSLFFCFCFVFIVDGRLIISVLPHGPTAFFKVSNVVKSDDIFNHGKVTAHQPEIILNNFNTRLGHRVGRFLGSFFPHVR